MCSCAAKIAWGSDAAVRTSLLSRPKSASAWLCKSLDSLDSSCSCVRHTEQTPSSHHLYLARWPGCAWCWAVWGRALLSILTSPSPSPSQNSKPQVPRVKSKKGKENWAVTKILWARYQPWVPQSVRKGSQVSPYVEEVHNTKSKFQIHWLVPVECKPSCFLYVLDQNLGYI